MQHVAIKWILVEWFATTTDTVKAQLKDVYRNV